MIERDMFFLLLGAAFALLVLRPQRAQRAARAEVPSEDVATAFRRNR